MCQIKITNAIRIKLLLLSCYTSLHSFSVLLTDHFLIFFFWFLSKFAFSIVYKCMFFLFNFFFKFFFLLLPSFPNWELRPLPTHALGYKVADIHALTLFRGKPCSLVELNLELQLKAKS